MTSKEKKKETKKEKKEEEEEEEKKKQFIHSNKHLPIWFVHNSLKQRTW